MVRSDGIVLGAHCNCVAGLGECCSHMSAVMFLLWHHNQGKEGELAVTSKKCQWSQPSSEALKRVEYAEGRNIVFNNSQRAKKSKTSSDQSSSSSTSSIPPLSLQEQVLLYNNLSTCQTQLNKPAKSAILSLIEGHADKYVPSIVKLDIPPPLTSLYTKEARDLSLPQLLEKSRESIHDITVTKEQVNNLIIASAQTVYVLCMEIL